MPIQQVYTLLQQGELQQAREACQDLIRLEPGLARARILMSAIEQKLGDPSSATRNLLCAARLQPGDTAAQLGIIRALRTIGALAEANNLLDQLDENLPEVLISRAQVQWQDGQYDQALKGFESAALRWPQQPETLLALARALLRLRDSERAAQVLQQAAEHWPANPEVSRLLAVLELDQGHADRALNHLFALADTRQELATPAAQNLPQKMRVALQAITDRADVPNTGPGDLLDRCFNWVRQQSAHPRWFGTNSGLLDWACRQLPADLPAASPVVECGVYHGFSLQLLANRTNRNIHGFDSFQGLPEAWKSGEPAGSYSTHGRLPVTAGHVQLHRGWFEETLPGFAAQLTAPVALLHVDCDLYSSTRTVLQHLGPHLAPGSLLVFDDFLSYEGYEAHEFRAAQEYFSSSRQRFELVGAVLLGRAVAYRRVAD